jgi:hypothetical protein
MLPVLAFLYTLTLPSYTYQVDVEATGALTQLLPNGKLVAQAWFEYAVATREPSPRVDFKAASAAATWNGVRLPISEAATAQLFPSKQIVLGDRGVVSVEGARSSGMFALPFADELPVRVLAPANMPKDLAPDSEWTESSGGLTLKARVLEAIPQGMRRLQADKALILGLTLQGELAEADRRRPLQGNGYALLDPVLGVGSGLVLELSLGESEKGNDRVKATIVVTLARPTTTSVPHKPAANVWDRFTGWATETLRWSKEQIASFRGYWSLVESLLANSIGGWVDLRPWLEGLTRTHFRVPR